MVMVMLCTASAGAAASPATEAHGACHVPRLTGLTLAVARRRAAHAGCSLRVKGARVEQALVQTVERQSPAAGRRSSTVTVQVNPFCRGEAEYPPEIHEPMVSTGPTELISGFYLIGGPLARFSDPHCKRPEPPPGAGTVEVIGPSGAVVATQTSTQGRFVEIPLPAGSYTIRGTFLGATINNVHPARTVPVVIPAGHTVRQDLFLNIP